MPEHNNTRPVDMKIFLKIFHATKCTLPILALSINAKIVAGNRTTSYRPILGILTCFQGPGDPADEDGLPGVERERGVEDEVCVGESPGSDLHRLVLDGRRGDAQVQLVVVLDARVDQRLHGLLVLQYCRVLLTYSF